MKSVYLWHIKNNKLWQSSFEKIQGMHFELKQISKSKIQSSMFPIIQYTSIYNILPNG